MKTDNEFIKRYTPIVRREVNRVRHEHLHDDLMQEGYYGLIVAGQKYNEDMHVQFESYASWWIRKYVVAAVQQYRHSVSLPSHPIKEYIPKGNTAFDTPLYEEDEDVVTIADVLAQDDSKINEIREIVAFIVDNPYILTARESKMLHQYFGLECKRFTVPEMSIYWRLSDYSIRRIVRTAIKKCQKNAPTMQHFL